MATKIIQNTSRDDLNKNISAFTKKGFSLREAWAEGSGFVEVSSGEFQSVFFSRGTNQDLIDKARATGRNLNVTYKAELEFEGEKEPFVPPTLERPKLESDPPKVESRPVVSRISQHVQIRSREGATFTSDDPRFIRRKIAQGGRIIASDEELSYTGEGIKTVVTDRNVQLNVSEPFLGEGGQLFTEKGLQKVIRERAEQTAEGLPKGIVQEKEFVFGTLTRETTPENVTEILSFPSGKTFRRTTLAPEGQQFVVGDSPVTKTPLKATINITEELIEQERILSADRIAEGAYAKADPTIRAILAGKVLSEPRGFDFLGALILRDYKTQEKIIKQSISEDILQLSKKEQARATVIRKAGGFIQGPAFSGITAFAGGAVIGTALKVPKIASLASTTAGKTALASPLVVGGGLTATEVKTALDEGEINRAVGIAASSAIDLAAGVAGFKSVTSKTPPTITKFKGLQRSKLEVKISKVGKTETLSEFKVVAKPKEKALAEVIQSKELPAFEKKFNVLKEKVPVNIETIKPGGAKTKVTITERGMKIEEPQKVFVAREAKTGKFARFGAKETTATKLGIKPKFPKVETLITVAGKESSVRVQTLATGRKGAEAISFKASRQILKPTSSIREPRIEKTPLIGRKFKGTVSVSMETPQKLEPKIIKTGTKSGFALNEPQKVSLRPLLLAIKPSVQSPETQVTAKQKLLVKQSFESLQKPELQAKLPEFKTIVTDFTDSRRKTKPILTPISKLGDMSGVLPKESPIQKSSFPEFAPTKVIKQKPPVRVPKLPRLPADLVLTEGGRIKRFGTKIIENPVPDMPDIEKTLRNVKIAI